MDRLPDIAVAAVVPEREVDCDELVAGFAIGQINRGRHVRGLVQETYATHRSRLLRLVDLETGQLYPISEFLGTHSVSCQLRTDYVAEATAVLRRIALHGADLAICNRFSKLEAHGGGFRDEMLDLMQRHIPLLTIVPPPHLEAWRDFTGGLAAELPPERSALEAWFATRCPQPREAAFH